MCASSETKYTKVKVWAWKKKSTRMMVDWENDEKGEFELKWFIYLKKMVVVVDICWKESEESEMD